MKFAIDANESPVIVQTWNDLFTPHEFIHIRDLNLQTLPDVELYEALAQQNLDGLFTRDKRQLVIPEERLALQKSGLSWIGHNEPSGHGIEVLAQLSASYCLAMPHIISLLNSSPSAVQIKVKHHPRGATQTMAAWDLSTQKQISLPN